MQEKGVVATRSQCRTVVQRPVCKAELGDVAEDNTVVGPRLSYFVRPVRRLLGCTNGAITCTEGDVGRFTLSDLGPVSVAEVSD